MLVVVFIVGTPFKNNFMRCYAGGDPGRASPVGQVRRATLAPFLYPLLFYQKSGQKSIIFCVANLTNGRKNRRNTAPEIVQYDEPHSARPGTLRQQERSPSRAPEAAPARRSRDRTESGERHGPQIIASPRAERPEPSSRREPQTIPAASGSDPRQRERVRQSRERGERGEGEELSRHRCKFAAQVIKCRTRPAHRQQASPGAIPHPLQLH